MFRKKRPGKSLIDAGWKFTKVKFQRVESCMSPRHPRWHDYRNAKRRATLLLAARLILKANDLNVPGSGAVSKTDVKAGSNPVHRTNYFRSEKVVQARRLQVTKPNALSSPCVMAIVGMSTIRVLVARL